MTISSTCVGTRHGTAAAYNNNRCRCPDAVALGRRQKRHATYARQRGGQYHVDATGTRRRLQALCRIGWDTGRLAELANLSTVRSKAMYGDRRRVLASTAATVIELYDRLSMTPGPSIYARRAARLNGWPPPLAWDDDTIDDPKARPYPRSRRGPNVIDEVAVIRLMQGDSACPHTPAERARAIHRMTADGESAQVIAERIGRSSETVVRHRRSITARLEGATA